MKSLNDFDFLFKYVMIGDTSKSIILPFKIL